MGAGKAMGKTPTYISLFSGAGVGCHGFKMNGFGCVATIELIERRLNIQKYNRKCKYDTGYICGDITSAEVNRRLMREIERWRKSDGLKDVDVVIATPPCQGMSVANHKKAADEIVRNSLVVESIKIIRDIRPKFFVVENVAAFMKTACTDIDGQVKAISEAIYNSLGKEYSIYPEIINFKNYGACSSRTRTMVTAVRKDLADHISPIELFPDYARERTLRQTIGDMRPLERMGEVDQNDIYHAFRPYPEHMRAWVSGLGEGRSAFENTDPRRVPHRVIDGEMVVNQQKNGDKYRRQIWDRVGPCIHTRNDQFASQNTIHPSDDRVFSVRELMRMMTIPDDFRWVDASTGELNALPVPKKQELLKKEETKIRQSLGEAVPTVIFAGIAEKIAAFLARRHLRLPEISQEIERCDLWDNGAMVDYIAQNQGNLGLGSLAYIAEYANANKAQHAAFFTNRWLVTEILCSLPDFDQPVVRILEPSVGVGNFIPLVAKKYQHIGRLIFDVVDIDEGVLGVFRALVDKMELPENVRINYIHADFLLLDMDTEYDLVIGNPPFSKLPSNSGILPAYRQGTYNTETTNTFSFFLEKALRLGRYVAMITPKFLLNTPEFRLTRELLGKKGVRCIIDFGENGFKGVLVETIAVIVESNGLPAGTQVISTTLRRQLKQRQSYIFDKAYPYWIIYRDEQFDEVARRLRFNIFTVFRDRQITNKVLSRPGRIRVIKSRNISDDGCSLVRIPGYDSRISKSVATSLSVYKYMHQDDVYLTPNMTYKPRVMKKPPGVLVNGSAAILALKEGEKPLTSAEMLYFASEEFRAFYQTARNYQTRSLNVDASSVFFFGRSKKEENQLGWLGDSDISAFLDRKSYDVRQTNNARWIDQKCAADVVATVADCILQYSLNHIDTAFSSMDIWHNEYTTAHVESIFKKPNPDEKKARNEYDKFFQQPMEMLAYAGVLHKEKHGNRNKYWLERQDVLEYIALRERNAMNFLCLYIEKVLWESGIYSVFEDFFQKQTKQAYEEVKDAFTAFTISNTPINGVTECRRIFIKVLNPLAYKRDGRGTEKGRISKHKITYDMLMYNRDNFRDEYSDKPKELTRGQYEEQIGYHPDPNVYKYQSQRAKRCLRAFNDACRASRSEVADPRHGQDAAVNMHHIFPEADYARISMYYENLIALTPTQHFGYAHPSGNTQRIDRQFQRTCLLAKAESIRENLSSPEQERIYEFSRFQEILAIGLDNDVFYKIESGDFDGLIRQIDKCYTL